MVVEVRRYLGNTLSVHTHDADTRPRTAASVVSAESRRWYDSLEEALTDLRYEDCSWCMGGSNGRHAVGAATSAETA